MIIGITGTIGSGKGTVVAYLARRGFRHYSASGLLKDMLSERGTPLTRANLSQLATTLSGQYEGGILQVAQERAIADGALDYVLEAIHRESEAQYVRSLGAVMWGVDADLSIRYARTMQRADGEKDAVTYEEFVEHTLRDDEGKTGAGPHIRAVLKGANTVFTNNGTLSELHLQIDAALKRLTK